MKIVLGILLLLNTVFANESLNSIYENILLNNSNQAVNVAKKLEIQIQNADLNASQLEFSKLVQAWKRVEAFYILADLDSNYIDTPRYIDTFHQGNEDIKEQLDLIISQKEALRTALYKNSHKSINALEYILFQKDLKEQRVKDISLIIIKKIQENLEEIQAGYAQKKEVFFKDEQKANAMMLNALIESSYKLKEWRVGDIAGLSRKYKDKEDNSRAEYFISENSIMAIQSILITHLQVLGKQEYKNFGDMIFSYKVHQELNDAIKYLNNALDESKKIKNDDFSHAQALYKNLKKLHTTYYISLIGKLKITSKILDADGD